MKLEIVPTQIKFAYDKGLLESLLRKVEATIKSSPPGVIETIMFHSSGKPVTATAKSRYPGITIEKQDLLNALTPGRSPGVTPMHQMYLAGGRDPDWVMTLSSGSPPSIMVLAELLLMWQKKPGNYFLTRQLTSIISMGLVNFLLDLKGNLSSIGTTVTLESGGVPDYLRKFADEFFGKGLGWSRVHYLPSREVFEAAGYKLPLPNASATHP